MLSADPFPMDHDADVESARDTSEIGIALAGELASSLNPSDVVNRLVKRTVEVLNADRATLSSIEGEEICIEATYARAGPLDWVGRRYPLDYIRNQPLVNEAIESRRPVFGGQLEVERAAPELQSGLREMEHTAVLPLILGNQVVSLLVLSRAGGEPFTIRDLSRLQELGNVAMLALRNARLYSDLENATAELAERVRELTLLLEIARTLAASLEIDVIYREVARSAAQLVMRGRFHERRATVFRIERDKAVLEAQYDEAGYTPADATFPIADHPGVAEAVHSNRVTTCAMSEVKGEVGEAGRAGGIKSGAYAPIRLGESVVAVLGVACRDDHGFEATDLSVLAGIAHLTGLAIGNAEQLNIERSRSEALAEHAQRVQELEQAKSQFLNLASHELRGPSTVLRGYLSMLTEGSLGEVGPQVAKILPMLVARSEQMHSLIEQMLEAARLEEGRLQLQPIEVDLAALARRAIQQVEPLWPSRGHVPISTPSEPVVVRADPERTVMILTNLLDNALKYSGEGKRVECAVMVDGTHAIAAVTDEGIGIAQADMPKLFTRFGRIVTPENSHIPGSGLGLYLSRHIAQLMDGDIKVSSVESEGSRFELLLPLASGRPPS